MINRKCVLASGIAAAVFAMSSVSAANLQTSSVSPVAQPNFPAPNGGSVVLYDQTDNAAGNGVPNQNFESSYDAYDAEGADDFVVPAGGWTIDTVNLVSTIGTPIVTTAKVNIYTDAGGVPSATTSCSAPAAVANVTATNTTITLGAPCSLAAGTYWLAVQTDVNFGTNGQVFWSNRTTQTGNQSVWVNPGDGFASGCTTFTPVITCGVGGGTNPDLLFQLIGVVGGGGGGDIPLGPVQELPTLGQWSMLFGAFGLAMLGMFGLRRRSRL
ncbi:hypothetical protein [Dokdonella sp.]|uniref:hypothetical protein n=1 Tax=Dokdonella sp. TaxID=2291710 RepID=UPI003C4048D2